MVDHLPRLKAIRQLEHWAVEELRDFTKAGREQVVGLWREIAGLGRWARGTVEAALWNEGDDGGLVGTADGKFVVAESFEDVEQFFAMNM